MRIIGALRNMRKGKQMSGSLLSRKRIPPLAVFFLAANLLFPSSAALAEGGASLSTRNNESGITRDPVTGDRVMQTPDAKPQPEYQGPQTIIVAPEVYPGNGVGVGDTQSPQPDRPNGTFPSRDRPRPDKPGGTFPSWDRPRPDRPGGYRPPWGRPQPDRPGDNVPSWDRPRPDRPNGTFPSWDRPRPDRPGGYRPPWGRPQPDRPNGYRPPWGRPQPDRPGGYGPPAYAPRPGAPQQR